MKMLTLGALAVTLSFPGLAAAQSKTLPGEMVEVKAKVEAIESGSRTINLRMDDGRIETIVAPDSMKTFNQIKVGDTVTAKYYDNIVVRKKEPGEKDINSWQKGLTPSATGTPAATAAKQRTITATVTAIDMNVPSITLKGPKYWTYSSKVADKDALAKVAVGDKVDITWTEALLLSVVPPK
jgi:hypothetical protein